MSDMISKVVFADDANLVSATADVTGSGAGSLTFYLGVCSTWDGTYTYEEVTSGVEHTFVATGKFLKWKGVGNNYTVTQILIDAVTV